MCERIKNVGAHGNLIFHLIFVENFFIESLECLELETYQKLPLYFLIKQNILILLWVDKSSHGFNFTIAQNCSCHVDLILQLKVLDNI